MNYLYELLKSQPVLTLFLIIGLGYLIGNVKLRGFSLGPVAGVLFAGLFFGHFGFKMSPGAQSVGFALFIFSVGYQAGPRFFDVLMTDGLKYFILALFIAFLGFSLSVLAAKLLHLTPGTAAGILSGGLTSSPTLAAAQEAIRAGSVAPPPGMTAEAVIGNITTGYAITYIFGLAGLIAIIKLLPGILGINLADEARKLEGEKSQGAAKLTANVTARFYRVDNKEFIRFSVAELGRRYWDGFAVVRVVRDSEVIVLAPDDYLRLGDEVMALGEDRFFAGPFQEIGEEITAKKGTAGLMDTAQIVVTNREVVGKTLDELNIARNYGVLLVGIKRMRIDNHPGVDL